MLSTQSQALAIPSQLRTVYVLNRSFVTHVHAVKSCMVFFFFPVLCIVESHLAGVNSKHIYSENTQW